MRVIMVHDTPRSTRCPVDQQSRAPRVVSAMSSDKALIGTLPVSGWHIVDDAARMSPASSPSRAHDPSPGAASPRQRRSASSELAHYLPGIHEILQVDIPWHGAAGAEHGPSSAHLGNGSLDLRA